MARELLNPVYAAQSLAGVAAIGTILADGNLGGLRLSLAAVTGLSSVVAIAAAMRTEHDSQRIHGHLETLLRSVELPYFIIRRLTETIDYLASKHGWQIVKQENFINETVYWLHKCDDSQVGLLLLSSEEFKEVWLLDEASKRAYLETRMLGTGPRDNSEKQKAIEHIEGVIRFAASQRIAGPHFIGIKAEESGRRSYFLRHSSTNQEIEFYSLSSSQQDDLCSQIALVRYAKLKKDVDEAISKVSTV